jgi:PAS domain S-box-containing protein
MEKSLNVIIIEDSPMDTELLLLRLKHEGYHTEYECVEKQADFLAALSKPHDLILSDWNLPEFDGKLALQLTRQHNPDIPFIIVSGAIGEDIAIEAMRLGANDYIFKDRPERLGKAIQNALEQKSLRDHQLKSEEKLQFQASLLENVHDAIYALNTDLEFTYWNHTAELIFGWQSGEVLGHKDQQILRTEFLDLPAGQVYQQLLSCEAVQVNLMQFNKIGQTYYIESKIRTLQDENGRISGYVFANRDITKRKIAEESLAISEAKYREFFNATKDVVFLKNESLQYIMVNKAARILINKEEEDILYKTDFELLPKEIALSCQKNDLQVLHQKHLIVSIEEYGGQIFESRKFPVPLGVQTGVGAYLQNITEKRKAETTLFLQAAALDAAANAIVITDRDGVIEWVNPAFTSLTGYSTKEAIGKPISKLVNSGQQKADFYEQLWHTIHAGQVWRGELVNQKKDGSLYTEEQSITPIFGKNNQIHQYVAIKQDISEKKKASFDLQQKTKEYQFLATAALHLPTMTTEDEVFSYISASITTITPDTFCAIMRLNHNGDQLYLDSIQGIDQYLVRKAIELIGVDFEHKPFESFDASRKYFSNTHLYHFPGRLADFAKSEIPAAISKQLEKILSINDIHSIGISGEDSFFGGIYFFTRADKNNINQSLVESFIRQCYLALSRIHTQKNLTESEENFRQMAENIHETFWLAEINDNKIIYISPAFEETWKQPRENLYHNPLVFQESLHPDDSKNVLQAISNIYQKDMPMDIEHRILLPDASIRWIHSRAYPVKDEKGNIIRIAGIAENITERIESLETLRKNSNRLRRAEQVSLTGNWEFDLTTRMVQASQGARSIYGLEDKSWVIEEIQMLPLLEYRPYLNQAIRDLISYNIPYDKEYKIRRPSDGQIIDIHSVAEYDPKRHVVFGIIQDISVRKKAEEAQLQAAEELRIAYDATIEGWSRAMDLRDKETEGHTQRVTEITLLLAKFIGVDEKLLEHIRRGSLLHDIGKLGVPDSILLKPGSLTKTEWIIMRKHPEYAYQMLSSVEYLHPALEIPYCHHEHWDGLGYPRNLKGENIPLPARIFTVVDVWDALISDRPYRKAWPKQKVYTYMKEQNEILFDPYILNIFLEKLQPKLD